MQQRERVPELDVAKKLTQAIHDERANGDSPTLHALQEALAEVLILRGQRNEALHALEHYEAEHNRLPWVRFRKWLGDQVEIIWGCYNTWPPLLLRIKFINFPSFKVYLHIFFRSDQDRELHDHPWTFVSFILWRGYDEIRPKALWRGELSSSEVMNTILREGMAASNPKQIIPPLAPASAPPHGWREDQLERVRVWPGMLLYRPAWWTHRVELPPGKVAVSLVFSFRKSRDWGFFTKEGWKLWKSFVDSRDCG